MLLLVVIRCGFCFKISADVKQWEYISYCLSQLAFTEKGLKKLIELFKTYEHVLSEDTVMDHFRNILNKVLTSSCPCIPPFKLVNADLFAFYKLKIGQEVCKTRTKVVY